MALTNNYNLNKPELDDKYDVKKFNENADIIDEELAEKATSTQFGRVKLSDSSAVTDSEGLALPATEKNASIPGTMANQINEINTNLTNANKNISQRVRYLPKSAITNFSQIDMLWPYPRIINVSGWDYPDNCPEKNKQWMILSIPYSDDYDVNVTCGFQLWMSEYGDMYKRSLRVSGAWTDFVKIS